MALRITGGFFTKYLKTNYLNPCFVVPSTVNLQVRYAARKGYREKARKKLAARKEALLPISKDAYKLKQKKIVLERTVEPRKPEPPNDDVFIINSFKPKKFSLLESIKFHQEYHHPTVYNNPIAPVFIRVELDMTGVKRTQVIKPFRGLVAIPHPFNLGLKREVLVFCGPEYVQEAIDSGGTVVGGTELVAKVKTGYVQPNLFEYVLCHVKFLAELTPIRSILKDKLPRPKSGTLTADLTTAIPRFLYGIEYACVKPKPTDNFGIINCQIGTCDMPVEQIEANFRALVEDIQQFRPNREGEFISYILCRSPPSKEEFAIDVTPYEKPYRKDKVDDDDDDYEEEGENQISEKVQVRNILAELSEKESKESTAN